MQRLLFLNSVRRQILSRGTVRIPIIHTRYVSDSSEQPSQPAPTPNDDAKLRHDVRMLGQELGNIIKQDDEDVFNSVEKLRHLGRKWRRSPEGGQYFDEMVAIVKGLDANKLIGVTRSFSHFLALSNSAENHHRVRRLRERVYKSGSDLALPLKQDSFGGTLIKLKDEMNIPVDTIHKAISTQFVEIVLTAHPTEVNRRTTIQKHQRIYEILTELDRLDLPLYERRFLMEEMRSQLASIWGTDELRRTKPGPVKEARSGLAVVENVLWHSVPKYLRKLDDVLHQKLGRRLPLESTPIKVASWMGGDRDGNPNVTPEITFEVSMMSRWLAATLFKTDIAKLRSELSIKAASEELLLATGYSREPYRHILREVENRLQTTIDWADQCIKNSHASSNLQPMLKSSELMEPLLLLHRSLIETKNHSVANGMLTDIIRKVSAFGLSLLPMDIRQESTRHSEALDAITRYLGLGSYLQWDESTRRNWLQLELTSKRPLLPRLECGGESLGFSPSVVDTLKTFTTARVLGEGSLGAYVISQCQQASDILAVALLQQDAGVNPPLRVVPLFETLDDLQRSATTIDALLSINAYRGRISNKQEIMVGYSDSAKDAGRLAASWAQYRAQEAMIHVGKKHGVDLTFFHGKGGTVGRGGNPALYDAILAHPPHTINGRFRITEQGEMITQNLGEDAIAQRTLDLFTSGVLMERFYERPEPEKKWRDMMESLSDISCDEYRNVVRGEPRFVPYFRTATPELELAGLNVGSRPSKRNPKGGVESLRAIPWIFSWTQTRLNLPTWLGVGEALNDQLEKNPEVLMEMYDKWPWFSTLIDLLEMILVKSEEKIAENYDKQLVSDKESLELGKELRAKLRVTTAAVLKVSRNPHLQSKNPILLRSLAVRNPYVDPLNVLQAELLRRLRDESITITNEELAVLKDALLITINGIANGMRNSG